MSSEVQNSRYIVNLTNGFLQIQTVHVFLELNCSITWISCDAYNYNILVQKLFTQIQKIYSQVNKVESSQNVYTQLMPLDDILSTKKL